MLSFLRRHAGKILIATVIFFALSIIIPTLIQNARQRDQRLPSRQQALSEQGIAYVNGKPIDPRKFRQLVNQGLSQVVHPQQKSRTDPRITAQIMYQALLQTIDHTLLLREAKKNRIRVGRGEVNKELDSVKKSI